MAIVHLCAFGSNLYRPTSIAGRDSYALRRAIL